MAILHSRVSFRVLLLLGIGLPVFSYHGSPVLGQDPTATKEDMVWKKLLFQQEGEAKGWQLSEFGGDGKVDWKGQSVEIGEGRPMTGIRYVSDFPKDNYELRFEARRIEGTDFFVGLTMPVAKEHVSLILGGWSGTVSGLSSINSSDASENETSFFREYKNGTWYRVRVSVTPDKIETWIDDQQVIDCQRSDSRFSIRIEVDPSLPLGFASYRSKSEIRNFEFRNLPKRD
jgi:hypothetical protein